MPSMEAMLITFAGRSLRGRPLFRGAVQGLGQEEGRLEVQIQHLVPAAFLQLVEPAGARRRRRC